MYGTLIFSIIFGTLTGWLSAYIGGFWGLGLGISMVLLGGLLLGAMDDEFAALKRIEEEEKAFWNKKS